MVFEVETVRILVELSGAVAEQKSREKSESRKTWQSKSSELEHKSSEKNVKKISQGTVQQGKQ